VKFIWFRWRAERKQRAEDRLAAFTIKASDMPPVTFHLPTRCPRCDEPVWDWPGYPHTCKGISAERIRAIFREELARAEPDRRGAGPG